MATIQILDNVNTLALMDTAKQEVEFRCKKKGDRILTLTIKELMGLTSNMLGPILQMATPVLKEWPRCFGCNGAMTPVRGVENEVECVRCKQ